MTVVTLLGIGALTTGVAHADVSLAVDPASGLTDGQMVQLTVSGINAIPLASVEISECGNAYGNNTPLPSLDPTTDCVVLNRYDVHATPTLVTSVGVRETGIGLGNRSCISAGNFSCDLRVTHTVNQMGSLPPPVPISFAADALGVEPFPTQTTVSAVGSPTAVGRPAYAHVAVTNTSNFFKAEGTVSVDVDNGSEVVPATLGADGTVSVAIGNLALGPHSLLAHFAGNGSFALSDSTSTSFDVISADNVSVGDASVVEGDAGFRKIAFPVILSEPSTLLTTVNWAIHAGTAGIPSDVVAASGRFSYKPGVTLKYVIAKVASDTAVEGDETFFVDLSSPTNSYVLRRARGTGTIIDDDAMIFGADPAISIGDSLMPEGDIGGPHGMKFPVSISAPQLEKVTVTVTFSSEDAKHTKRSLGGDWNGVVIQKVSIPAGRTRVLVGVSIFPDTVDELDLHVHAALSAPTALTVPVILGRDHATGMILSDE